MLMEKTLCQATEHCPVRQRPAAEDWLHLFVIHTGLLYHIFSRQDLAEAPLSIHKKCEDGSFENGVSPIFKMGKIHKDKQPAKHLIKAGVSKTYTWCIGSVRKMEQY